MYAMLRQIVDHPETVAMPGATRGACGSARSAVRMT